MALYPPIPNAGCRDLTDNCSSWKSKGYCDPSWYAGETWQRVGSYWCQATCGACKGPEASWTAAGPISNKQFSAAGVGVFVYKSSAPFNSHIEPFLEHHAGAHYYVQTTYTTDYSSAMAYITLPTFDLKGRRIPCLAFAVMSKRGSVDFAVENKGSGWFAMYYSGAVRRGENGYRTYPSAAKVLLSMDVYTTSTNDVVSASFTFYDKAGSRLGEERLAFKEPYNTFFELAGMHPRVRWIRFMSFLHSNGQNDPAGDIADQAWMSNAKFSSLQLYNWSQRKYVVWDMSRIEHAWSVETANIPNLQISPSSAPTSDSFSAIQQVWYV